MLEKKKLRKKFLQIRRKKYFEVNKDYFTPLKKLISKIFKRKKLNLSIYYPSNNEVNTLKFLEVIDKKITTLLPVIDNKNDMKFCIWSNLDILKVNKYGMLEPSTQSKSIIPEMSLVPLLAFDEENYRLGYGKGFYDKFLNKYLKLNKKIITVGVAFSFQKYDNLPSSILDVKLNYILTERGIKKL
jgi:5-formyltetrahydrofolate cyclo-ligase